MKGPCVRCHLMTTTCKGAEERVSRGRPPLGYRLGYALERAERIVLICSPCVTNSLPSNVTA